MYNILKFGANNGSVEFMNIKLFDIKQITNY